MGEKKKIRNNSPLEEREENNYKSRFSITFRLKKSSKILPQIMRSPNNLFNSLVSPCSILFIFHNVFSIILLYNEIRFLFKEKKKTIVRCCTRVLLQYTVWVKKLKRDSEEGEGGEKENRGRIDEKQTKNEWDEEREFSALQIKFDGRRWWKVL